MAKIMSMNLYQFNNFSNCEEDNDQMLELDFGACHNVDLENISYPSQENNLTPVNDIKSTYPDYFIEETFDNVDFKIELTSMRYFVGYVAFKVISKIKCNQCEELMRKTDEVITCPSELLIFARNYSSNSDFGNLYAPSDTLFNICKIHVAVFQDVFQHQMQIINIKQQIIAECKRITEKDEEYNLWFDEKSECFNHRMAILEFLILVLLRKHCYWATQKHIKSKNRKVQILC